MPIAIDQKSDTVPVPATAFKNFAKKLQTDYTDDVKIKKDLSDKTDIVKKAFTKLVDSSNKVKDGSILFHLFWLPAFEAESEVGTNVFEKIKDRVAPLEAEAKKSFAEDKQVYAAAAAACKAATDEVDVCLKAIAALNRAVEEGDKAGKTATSAAGAPAQPAPAGINPASTQPVKENLTKELASSKRLLKLGFITENEHLANLVRIKKILKEAPAPAQAQAPAAQPAAPAPAQAQAPAAAADARKKLGTVIANLTNKDSFFQGYAEQIAMMQDAYTKASQQPINESQKTVIKESIKARIFEDYQSNKIDKRTFLNELFGLLAIIAGLLGIGAFIGKKFANYFKSGPAVYMVPDQAYTRKSTIQEDSQDIEGSLESLNGAYGPDGRLYGIQSGKQLNPAHHKESINTLISNVNLAVKSYAEQVAAMPGFAAGCGYPAESQGKITTAINAIPKTLTAGPTVVTKLQEVLKV